MAPWRLDYLLQKSRSQPASGAKTEWADPDDEGVPLDMARLVPFKTNFSSAVERYYNFYYSSNTAKEH